MYLFRAVDPAALALYALLSLIWAGGGWLLAVHAFRLRASERLLAGLAIGWIAYITLSNLLARILPLPAAFWGGSLLVLGMGAISAWKSRERKLPGADWRSWPQLLTLGAVVGLLAMIQRGLAIFDEFVHVPLVSVMAAGDIPPHFFLNPSMEFGYHTALQEWAASLVRLADATPWAAWDLAKALSLGLTFLLGWLWMKRWVRDAFAAGLGSLLLVFGSGAMWLLLLLPPALLQKVSAHVHLINTALDTGPNLAAALTRPWVIEGGGPLSFPFAFQNGIFNPIGFTYGNSAALPYLTILLLLLLATRSKLFWMGAVTTGLLLANLALSAEFLFPFLGLCLAVCLAAGQIFVERDAGEHERAGGSAALRLAAGQTMAAGRAPIFFRRLFAGGAPRAWAALAVSAALSLIQGGAIGVRAHALLLALQGRTVSSTYTDSFSLRWPPGTYSAHTGALSLTDPAQLLILLADLGPVLFLAPVMVFFLVRRFRRRDYQTAAWGACSLLLFLFPVFVQYGVDRSTTRIPMTALWIWLALGLPWLVYHYRRGGQALRVMLGAAYAVVILGGLVTFALQIPAIQTPQYTYFIQSLDARFAQMYWNRLEPGAQVLDRDAYRGPTVFGRAATAHESIYVPLKTWEALVADPDPAQIAQAGFAYLYMDERWWHDLTPAQQAALAKPCVVLVAGIDSPNGDFRRLSDLHACR